jgi:hypothetical protein
VVALEDAVGAILLLLSRSAAAANGSVLTLPGS